MTDQIPDASVFDSIDPALKVVTAEIEISAPAEAVFELIADPQRQPEWDGNDNLGTAVEGQRVRGTGGSFITTLTKGVDRENHIADFEEGRLIAWKPSEVGGEPFGQKWVWQIEPIGGDSVLVRHIYDWTKLRDPQRLSRAQSTTVANLLASLKRLKQLAER
ncbi:MULTISPECIES: SRPBCC family protein [unclassified Brevibacterium]|uniref:SRPBCC family protein n=1 Tax=unclassified Brevibacterium TaxID=2614124 RepID=UPI0010928D4A|nr:SRPBCC family protein [Brevibacterium sp. S22]TGD31609.1 polyketide cyclase [Brevibacterium sp. S22]